MVMPMNRFTTYVPTKTDKAYKPQSEFSKFLDRMRQKAIGPGKSNATNENLRLSLPGFYNFRGQVEDAKPKLLAEKAKNDMTQTPAKKNEANPVIIGRINPVQTGEQDFASELRLIGILLPKGRNGEAAGIIARMAGKSLADAVLAMADIEQNGYSEISMLAVQQICKGAGVRAGELVSALLAAKAYRTATWAIISNGMANAAPKAMKYLLERKEYYLASAIAKKFEPIAVSGIYVEAHDAGDHYQAGRIAALMGKPKALSLEIMECAGRNDAQALDLAKMLSKIVDKDDLRILATQLVKNNHFSLAESVLSETQAILGKPASA